MKTVFHIRRKGVMWDYIRNPETNKPLCFDTPQEAESEITWRIQHDPEFKTGTYEIVPHATI